MKDKSFMQMAIERARLAFSIGNLPSGAIIVLNDEIIGRGHRLSKLDHAEIIALREAIGKNKSARDMTIYTTLEPCIMCFGTILHLGIGRVVYALEDPYGGATDLPISALAPRYYAKYPQITKGVLRKEARNLFKDFFQNTDDPFWQNAENPLAKLCLSEETAR